ncbi:replication protein A 70 kDa DNA-binding subunit [Trifolium repens]|nr:replication protein A 70 kDa DNA-binding subunit [Trifolium repens]
MANSGMYLQKTKIAEISAGKIDLELQVRVINLWTTPDRNNPAEDGAIHMIFLDQDCGKIHATVRKDLIPLFKDEIREGCTYVFERFMVAKNDVAFRSTLHKHKLNFMRRTKVFRISGTEIPQNHFDFMPFDEILSKTNEDQLLDVIGHVVEKNDIKETEKNGKISKIIDATLEDLEGNRIHCTLWDDYALLMQRFLDTHDPSLPVVIIIQLCKLKKYLGVMGISNAFYGTKLMLNADIPEVTDYIQRMNDANVELTQVLSQVSGPAVLSVADDLMQTRRMTIEDLIESTEKCYGTVLAWACEIDNESGWFYQACTKCASRITFMGGQLYCVKCNMPRTAIPRFKVNLQVMDDTGSITFIMFDRVVTQFIGRTSQDLLDTMNRGSNSDAYPHELDVFVNKRMLFKVEVTDANLFRNWRGYTVKKLSYDEEVINRFTTLYGINLGDDGNHALLDDVYLGDLDGDESTCNKVVALPDGATTPTSKVSKANTSNIDGVESPSTKESESPTKSIGKKSVGRKLPIVDDCDTPIAKDVSPSPMSATKSAGKASVGQKGLEPCVAKEPTTVAGEPTAPNTNCITPPSHIVTRSVGKKLSSVEVVGASIAKEPYHASGELPPVDPAQVSSAKYVGKRSIDVDGWEIVAPKEPRMSCVKSEGHK